MSSKFHILLWAAIAFDCIMIAALVTLAVYWFTDGRGTVAEKPGEKPGDEIVSEETMRGDWPIFRGDAALSGVARTTLPEEIVLVWSYETGGAIKSSPVVGEGLAFVASGNKVHALRLTDGTKVWEFTGEDAMEAPPMLHDQCLFVGSAGGILYALNARDGTCRWQYATKGRITGSPNWALCGQRSVILVGSHDFCMHCVDAVSGEKVWIYETESYVNGSPAVSDGRVVFGGCDGRVYMLSAADGSRLASLDIQTMIPDCTPFDGKRAFVGHYGNRLICVDLLAQEVVWQYGEENGEPFASSPAITRDRVVAGSLDQIIHCVERDTGRKIWTYATRGEINGSPVISADRVVAGSADGRLYVLNLQTGEKIWTYEIGQPVCTSPAVTEGMVIVGSHDRVYAFGERRRP